MREGWCGAAASGIGAFGQIGTPLSGSWVSAPTPSAKTSLGRLNILTVWAPAENANPGQKLKSSPIAHFSKNLRRAEFSDDLARNQCILVK